MVQDLTAQDAPARSTFHGYQAQQQKVETLSNQPNPCATRTGSWRHIKVEICGWTVYDLPLCLVWNPKELLFVSLDKPPQRSAYWDCPARNNTPYGYLHGIGRRTRLSANSGIPPLPVYQPTTRPNGWSIATSRGSRHVSSALTMKSSLMMLWKAAIVNACLIYCLTIRYIDVLWYLYRALKRVFLFNFCISFFFFWLSLGGLAGKHLNSSI